MTWGVTWGDLGGLGVSRGISEGALIRQQILKPNREIHEIGDNLNLGLGEPLISATLHDERDTAPPRFHGTPAIEDIGDGGIEGHGANAVV